MLNFGQPFLRAYFAGRYKRVSFTHHLGSVLFQPVCPRSSMLTVKVVTRSETRLAGELSFLWVVLFYKLIQT